jgi:geranylgeranyl pyrophosphate synthase
MMGADAARAEQRVVEALGSFGWNMGLAFQIMDDTLDICGGNTGKQQAKDIIEHKLGNAVILVGLKFMSGHDKRRLMTILGSKRVTSGMAAEARSLIMATPAETSCREIARSYSDRAKRSLSVLKDSPYRRGLEDLCDAMVYRSF